LTFERFGRKQLTVMRWWADPKLKGYQAIICDGAVRSGKTSVLALSFAIWAMESFDGCDFALCGKTIGSVRRNLADPLKQNLQGLCSIRESRNVIELKRGGRVNRFHLFGDHDEQ